MTFKEFYNKNKKILIIVLVVITIVILVFVGIKIMNRKSSEKNSIKETTNSSNSLLEVNKNNNSNSNLIIEKKMDFKELINFEQEMQRKYNSNDITFTKLNRCLQKDNYYEYKTDESFKLPHALLILQKNYNISNKIHFPYFIFLPELDAETTINGNKYWDLDLNELKQYHKEKNKTMYIIEIKDLEKRENNSISIQYTNDNEQQNITTITLEKLDEIWENEKFQIIKPKIVASSFDRLSENPELGPKLNTILYIKEDQENNIPKDDVYKMFIYITLSDEEKENKNFWKDNNTNTNQLFNKKYKEVKLEDILKIKNREIIIFKIKKADYKDKQNNPNSEGFLE